MALDQGLRMMMMPEMRADAHSPQSCPMKMVPTVIASVQSVSRSIGCAAAGVGVGKGAVLLSPLAFSAYSVDGAVDRHPRDTRISTAPTSARSTFNRPQPRLAGAPFGGRPSDPRRSIVACGHAGRSVRRDQERTALGSRAFRTGPQTASGWSRLMARGELAVCWCHRHAR
jgi:hypothetical protein